MFQTKNRVLYCDESYLNNPYITLGALRCTDIGRQNIDKKLSQIKINLNYSGELKWNKIKERTKKLYIEFLNVFLQKNGIVFYIMQCC